MSFVSGIARDLTGSRFPNGLGAESAENDLTALINRVNDAEEAVAHVRTVPAAGTITVEAFEGITSIQLTGFPVTSLTAPNEVTIDFGAGTGGGAQQQTVLDLVGQIANSDDNVTRALTYFDAAGYTEARLTFNNTNPSGDGFMKAQWWDGAAWQDIASVVVAGTSTFGYDSGWVTLAAGAKADVPFRLLHTGTAASTDIASAHIHFRGPAPVGATGPAGPAGADGGAFAITRIEVDVATVAFFGSGPRRYSVPAPADMNTTYIVLMGTLFTGDKIGGVGLEVDFASGSLLANTYQGKRYVVINQMTDNDNTSATYRADVIGLYINGSIGGGEPLDSTERGENLTVELLPIISATSLYPVPTAKFKSTL